jgi:hypothetical protein
MTISENHWLVRWAFLFSFVRHANDWEWQSRRQISLCWLFWRGVFCTLLPILAVSSVVTLLVVQAIMDFFGLLTGIGIVVGILVGIGLFIAIGVWWDDNSYSITSAVSDRIDDCVVTEYVKAIKKRVCPIVTIRRD